jgi:hypothetical protein
LTSSIVSIKHSPVKPESAINSTDELLKLRAKYPLRVYGDKPKMTNQIEVKKPYPNTVSISELERKNSHWFSEGNKRFFKSMWDSYALQNEGSIYAYFVSSEKHESSFAGINEPRKYTVRKFNMLSGNFAHDKDGTIFEFQKYATKKQAEKAMREYLKTEPIKADKLEYLQYELKELQYQEKQIAPKMQKIINEIAELTAQ